jgi:uncharacterized ParB-like nuclease family protein
MEQIMECLVAAVENIDVNQERMMSKLDAYQEKMDAWLEEMKGGRKETTTCLEATEANPGEQQSVAVHHEVPKEDAAVEMIET